MSIRTRLAALFLAVGAALGGGVALTAPAHAATSNTQLLFVDNYNAVYSVKVYGLNQYGNYTEKCWDTPAVQNPLANWWWQGSVSVRAFSDQGCTGWDLGSTHTDIAPSGQWTAVIRYDADQPRNDAQVEFFDNQHKANSIWISGQDIWGNWISHCVATPSWDNKDGDTRHFRGDLVVYTYPTGNCSGSVNGSYWPVVNGNQSYFAISD